jgi:hypothetical protein
MELVVRNVIEALHRGTTLLLSEGVVIPSRGGQTLEARGPVYTIYYRPMERVLFAPARDANPFLHFFEALWMLQGRDDLRFMKYLSKNFEKYSDDGLIMQGSYGRRWRFWFGLDQIQMVIDLLRQDPDTRRAVISMWDPEHDLENIDSTDIPCNTQIYFKIRGGNLHMTVCNRSNDMLWGAYGANVVHMSMLQEYIAFHVGVPVGTYVQQSDSFHVYLDGPGGEVWARIKAAHALRQLWQNPYEQEDVSPFWMFANTTAIAWDRDLARFFELFDRGHPITYSDFTTPFFSQVVTPMWIAYKDRDIHAASLILAYDWRKAAMEWLERRIK